MTRTGADVAKVLQEHRPLLLACEAIGWLHMAGKAHLDFLRKHGGVGVEYENMSWHKQLNPGWSERLDWLLRTRTALKWPDSLVEFTTRHAEGTSVDNLVGCLQAGHAMASGIEKNIPRDTSRYLEQDATHMWLATAFGHPVRNMLADPPELLHPGAWNELLQRIGALLDELKKLGTNPPADVQPWWTWRDNAIGERGWLRRAFESTLAETRLPNNDVTLWDQSYVAAALFKSAVAGLVLLEKRPDEAWKNLKSETRWRVLTVGFGTEYYEGRAVRIGDWSGAMRDIEELFEEVRRLIEVDLAVGSLVYRDDQVLAFTFPGQRFDDGKDPKGRSLSNEGAEPLREWIGAEVDKLAEKRKFETPPLCQLSGSTRSFIRMASEASEARKRLLVPVHRPWTIPNTAESEGRVCPVCRVRFSGRDRERERNPKQRPCKICYGRRKGRLDAWLQEGTDTIWITELADDNDRVALLTFGFDLDPWLDGSRVDSLRAQSVAAWRRFNPVLYKNPKKQEGPLDNPIRAERVPEALVQYIENKLSKTWDDAKSDVTLRSLHDGVQHDSSWESFYEKVVWDRADAPRWEDVDNGCRARWLVHQLFRKNASPGRVYRFWRTAEAFFDELIPVFREAAAADANRWRTRRLVLTPGEGSGTGWQDRETYATRWNDAPLELLYRAETNDFLTICNLARVLRPEERATALRDKTRDRPLELEGDEGHEAKLVVGAISDPKGLGTYAPLIVLDRRPARFRVMVPLNAAPACIEAAVTKWEKEFSRVWDRMPLRVGIVAFPRLTPFQAVIEATRNLEDDLSRDEQKPWRVAESHVRDGVAALMLARPDGAHELVTVPVALPDGRADEHYPYFAVTDQRERHQRDFTTPASNGRGGQVYRHVADLALGDGVKVAPSRLAMIFMDSTARRFEPADVCYLSDWRRLRETWNRLSRTAPSVTALRGAWAALADARERWKGDERASRDGSATWASFARSVLANDLGARPPELEALVEAAVSGVLEKTLEWHLRILKLDLGART